VPPLKGFYTFPPLVAALADRREATQYRVLCRKKTQTRRVFKKGAPIEHPSLIVSVFRLQSTSQL
jgi:hypothetical protein